MSTLTSFTKPWIVIVGGFLGAGKTTLLLAAAQELERRGLRSAIILNDQSEALVDTNYTTLHGIQSVEVTGGCFCCRFSDLVHAMDALHAHAPDVIFAEPVGSCTDISATILQPLREYSEHYQLAPFTVLVDPARANILLRENADPNLSFLFRNQLREADLVCFTKADLHSEFPKMPGPSIRQISAKTGQGVAAWLDEVLSGRLLVGSEILDIDYEQYAQAEAALAWLNLQVSIKPRKPLSAAMVLGPLLNRLDIEFTAAGIVIVHLKAIINSSQGFIKAAICTNGEEPVVEGALDSSPSSKYDLLLNLRALGVDTHVREVVQRELGRIDAELSDLHISCFHPAAPNPERRIPALR
jgi:CobW/HypB/UreG family nucleotide-binding protein